MAKLPAIYQNDDDNKKELSLVSDNTSKNTDAIMSLIKDNKKTRDQQQSNFQREKSAKAGKDGRDTMAAYFERFKRDDDAIMSRQRMHRQLDGIQSTLDELLKLQKENKNDLGSSFIDGLMKLLPALVPLVVAALSAAKPEEVKPYTTIAKSGMSSAGLASDAIKAASTLGSATKTLGTVGKALGKFSDNKYMNGLVRVSSGGMMVGRALEGDTVGAVGEGASLGLHEAARRATNPKAKAFLTAGSLATDAGLIVRDMFSDEEEAVAPPTSNQSTSDESFLSKVKSTSIVLLPALIAVALPIILARMKGGAGIANGIMDSIGDFGKNGGKGKPKAPYSPRATPMKDVNDIKNGGVKKPNNTPRPTPSNMKDVTPKPSVMNNMNPTAKPKTTGVSLYRPNANMLQSKIINVTPKAAAKPVANVATKAVPKAAVKAGAVGAAKIGAKALPFAGAALGAYGAYDRASNGDYLGAAGEVASGLVSFVPVIGTGAAMAIQGGLMARDMSNASGHNEDSTGLGLGTTAAVGGGALLLASRGIIKTNLAAKKASEIKKVDEVGETITKSAKDAGDTVNKTTRTATRTMDSQAKALKSYMTKSHNTMTKATAEFYNNLAKNPQFIKNAGLVMAGVGGIALGGVALLGGRNAANPLANSTNPRLEVSRQGRYSKLANKNTYDGLMKDIYSKNGYDPRMQAVLKAQVAAESNFDINAKSHVGAFGLTQFMPKTAAAYGVKRGDAKSQLDGQARYMKYLLKRFNGNLEHALMAYNWGEGNVGKWLKSGKTKSIPKETRDYVAKIMGNTHQYNPDFGVSTNGKTIDTKKATMAKGTLYGGDGKKAGVAVGAGAAAALKGNETNNGKANVDFDLDAICQFAVGNASKTSLGRCAEYVRKALQAGDNKKKIKGGLGHARDWGKSLASIGWERSSGGLRKGDIAWFPTGMSGYGHVAIWTGAIWVSDFIQKTVQPNSKSNLQYYVYRAKSGYTNGSAIGASGGATATVEGEDGYAGGGEGTEGEPEKSVIEQAQSLVTGFVADVADGLFNNDLAQSAVNFFDTAKVDAWNPNAKENQKGALDTAGFDKQLQSQRGGFKYDFGDAGVDRNELFNRNAFERQKASDVNHLGVSGSLGGVQRQLGSSIDHLGRAGDLGGIHRQEDSMIDHLGMAGNLGGIQRQGGGKKKQKWYDKLFNGKHTGAFRDLFGLFGLGDMFNLGSEIYGAHENDNMEEYGLKKLGELNKDNPFGTVFNEAANIYNAGENGTLIDYGINRSLDLLGNMNGKNSELIPDYNGRNQIDGIISDTNKQYVEYKNKPSIVDTGMIEQPSMGSSNPMSHRGSSGSGMSAALITRNPDSIFREVSIAVMKATIT